MNTRSFFKSLALITAGAVVAPGLFIPKLEPARWKIRSPRAILNPEWVTAKYEVFFYGMPPIYDSSIFENDNNVSVIKRSNLAPHHHNWEPYPVRGNTLNMDGLPISIPPFILA